MDFGGNQKKREYENPKVGLHAARIYKIADLGTQTEKYSDKPETTSRRMVVWWELAQTMADGRPFSVYLEYNQFLASEKSKLRGHLKSWTGKDITKEIIKSFDPKVMMLGKACMVNLVLNANNKVKVDGLLAIPDGLPKPALVNSPAFFDLDAFDQATFDGLPNWIRAKIIVSPEYRLLHGDTGAEKYGHDDAPPPSTEEDDIPF